MTKCKKCGLESGQDFKHFICMGCDFVNEGDIDTVVVKDANSLMGVMGEKQ